MDAWFEEDEEIFVHPRSPTTRVQILPSSRHIAVDGTVVAESSRPMFLHETGLPRRTYVPKLDVRMDRSCLPRRARKRAPRRTGRSRARPASTPTSRGATRRRSANRRRSPGRWRCTTPASTSPSTVCSSRVRRGDIGHVGETVTAVAGPRVMRHFDSLRDWLDRRREPMECRAAVELLTDYLEDALDTSARRRFEAHLASCPACTAYLDQMQATIDVLGRLRPGQLKPDVRDELVTIYRNFHTR